MTMISSFPDDPQFAALHAIDSSCATDKESGGFFENVMQLQVYQRQRALFKLNEKLVSGEVFYFDPNLLIPD